MEEKFNQDEINLVDLWRIIWKNRFWVGGFVFLVVLLTMIVSLFVPKSYKAKGVILPSFAPEVSLIKDIAQTLGITQQQISYIDICFSILKSKNIQDKIIDKFDLIDVYKTETREDTRKKLSKLTEINKTKEGTIEISVIDLSPERARDIVNSYIIFLDEIIRSLNITKASQKRLFIEKRLKETESELKLIEEKLKNYQIEKKIAVGRNETTAAQTAGELQGKYLAKKVELETIKKFSTVNNPNVIKLENEVKELEKALVNLPPLETEIQRLLRDLKTQETLYTFLVSEYEAAKIEEARDTPTISVIDWAETPEKKYKPKISLNLFISFLASSILIVTTTFLKEFYKRIKDELK